MAKESLNGSVELLAKAMRTVFSEAVEGAVAPLRDDIAGISDGMATKADIKTTNENMATKADIKTTNENMQSQFAEQEKKIGQLLKEPR